MDYKVRYKSGLISLYTGVESIVDKGDHFYLINSEKKILAVINKTSYDYIAQA